MTNYSLQRVAFICHIRKQCSQQLAAYRIRVIIYYAPAKHASYCD